MPFLTTSTSLLHHYPQSNASLTQLLAKHQLWMDPVFACLWLLSRVGNTQGLVSLEATGATLRLQSPTSVDPVLLAVLSSLFPC